MTTPNPRSEAFDAEQMTTFGREPVGTRPLTEGDKRVIEWLEANDIELIDTREAAAHDPR